MSCALEIASECAARRSSLYYFVVRSITTFGCKELHFCAVALLFWGGKVPLGHYFCKGMVLLF